MSELVFDLLGLYRAAQAQTVPDFEHILYRLVERFIPISSAILASFQSGPDGLRTYGIQLYNEPEALADELPRFNRSYDKVIQRVVSRPRTAFAVLQKQLFPQPEDRQMVDYIRRYGHSNVMAIADIAHPQARGTWMSLYRSREDHSFSHKERRMLTLLMPHISQAQAINQQINGLREPFDSGDAADSCAVATPQGRIVASSVGFARLLSRSWGDWHSACLPSGLLEALQSSAERACVLADRVAITCRSSGGYLFLRARPYALSSGLTPREMQIGRLYARGFRHKSVARELGLSPVTVRNVLPRIYRKLKINNKIALAQVLGIAESYGIETAERGRETW